MHNITNKSMNKGKDNKDLKEKEDIGMNIDDKLLET